MFKFTLDASIVIKSSAAAILLAVFTTGSALAGPDRNFTTAPDGSDGLLLFMANGIIDPTDTSYTPPDITFHDTVIMGRSAQEAADRKTEAKDFFENEFGIVLDCGDFSCDGNFAMVGNYLDPRVDYRAYYISQDFRKGTTDNAGYLVHDSNYAAVCFSAAGCVLTGNYGGVTGEAIPFGSVVVKGEYLIQGNPGGLDDYNFNDKNNIYISWQSAGPIENAITGNIVFDCRMFSEQAGQGVALGRQNIIPLSDGRIQTVIRNVITFPAPEGYR